MLLNWRSRFGATPRSVLGIEACDDGLAVVHVDLGPSGPLLRHCEFFATTSGESRSAGLTKWVSTQSLRRFSCNWVICPGQYNLLLLEAPRVAPEEMREAILYSVDYLELYSSGKLLQSREKENRIHWVRSSNYTFDLRKIVVSSVELLKTRSVHPTLFVHSPKTTKARMQNYRVDRFV